MNTNSTMKKVLVLGLFGLFANISFGQNVLTENFEGALDPGTQLPTGWSETGLSSDGIYSVGDTTGPNATGFWNVDDHTKFAVTNDDACNCDKSADRIILPSIDLSSYASGSGVVMTYSAVHLTAGGATVTIEVSTDGGATFTAIGTVPNNGSTDANGVATTPWGTYTAALNAYVGQANVIVSFVYDDNAAFLYGFGLDDVSIDVVPPYTDVAIVDGGIQMEYTITPEFEASPIPVSLDVENIGTQDVTNLSVTTVVFDVADLATPLATLNQVVPSIVSGAAATVAMGSFTPTFAATYAFVHFTSASGDTDTSNDTIIDVTTISDNEFARDNGTYTTALGIGAGNTLQFGNLYTVTEGVTLDSASVIINPQAASIGNTVKLIVTGTTGAGVPNGTILGESAIYTIAAAGGQMIKEAIFATGTTDPLVLSPGTYFVAYQKLEAAGGNHGVQSSAAIFTATKTFIKISAGAYQQVSAVGFSVTPSVRAYLSVVPPFTDVEATTGFDQEYTILPRTEASTQDVSLTVTNTGTLDAATVNITANVYNLTDLATPLATYSGVSSNLVVAANETVALGTYTYPGTGDFVFEYIVSTTGDTKATNDTLYQVTSVRSREYARDNGTPVNGIGVGAGNDFQMGNIFDITTGVNLDSALVLLSPAAASVGQTFNVIVTGVDGTGIPDGTIIGESPMYTIPAAGAQIFKTEITATGTTNPLFLTPGRYFVAYKKGDASFANHAIQITASIVTPNTSYAKVGAAGAYTELGALGFANTPVIRAFVSPDCSTFSIAATSTQDCGASEGTATVVATGGQAPYTYAWSTTETTASISNLATGSYDVIVMDALGCTLDSVGVFVDPATVPTFTNLNPTVCNGATAPTLSTTSINNVTGTWNPATLSTAVDGTYTSTFTPDAGQCATSVELTLTVTSTGVTATFDALAAVCAGTTVSPLPTTSNEGFTGTWDPAIFNTTTAGTFTATFTPDANQCATSATISLTVNAKTVPTFSTFTSVCQGATAPALLTTSQNSISGQWNPATFSTATAGTFTSVFTPTAGQCASTTSVSLTVDPKVTPTFTAVGPFCSGDAIAALPTTSTNTPGVTGTWSPAISNTQTRTYTFTPTVGQCANTAQMTITVTPKVNPTFTPFGKICDNTVAPALPATSNNAINGSWNPGTINTTIIGPSTYVFTPTAGQCANTASLVVTISNCAGVEENSAIEVSVAPNPSTGIFNINVGNATITTITVLDLTGKTLNVPVVKTTSNYSLDMSAYANGIYMVQLNTENGTGLVRIEVIH